MTRNKNTKKALLASLLSMVICFVMLVGSTFAWFTDTATTGVNTIQSGNLDVKLSYKNNTVKSWTEVNVSSKLFNDDAHWEPGYTEVAYLKVENNGNLAFEYRLTVNVFNEVIGKNMVGGDIKLSEVLKYDLVELATDMTYSDRTAAMSAVKDAKKLATETVSGNMVADADVKYFALIVYMPAEIDNKANHNGINVPSIQLGVNVIATQYTVENDSFGNTYDELAQYPKAPFVTSAPTTNNDILLTNVSDRILDSKGDISVLLPKGSLDNLVTETTLRLEMGVDKPQGITVGVSQSSTTWEISVVDQNGNAISNNTKVYVVNLNIGKNQTNVKLYHYDDEISDFSYDPDIGILEFATNSFSPYTVVHNKEKIHITYMSNAGVEIGTLSYEVDADNSEVFSDLKVYENFIKVEEFKNFTEKVAAGGNGNQQLVGMPYYLFGDSKPTKVSYGNETFFYNDKECTQPASFPTEAGKYTVYCKFANHYLNWFCLTNPVMIYPDNLGETYTNTVKSSTLGTYMSMGMGSQAVATPSDGWTVIAEMKDSNGEWISVPAEAIDNYYWEPKFDLTKLGSKGDTVNLRIIDLYCAVRDSEDNVMYYSHVEKIPTNTEFILTIG